MSLEPVSHELYEKKYFEKNIHSKSISFHDVDLNCTKFSPNRLILRVCPSKNVVGIAVHEPILGDCHQTRYRADRVAFELVCAHWTRLRLVFRGKHVFEVVF